MCKSPLHPLLAALPKCEQHMHLEGALSPTLLFTLAARNNITLPTPTSDPAWTSPSTLLSRYESFTDLNDFLHYYYLGMSTLIQSHDFEDLAMDYFRRAKADGVVHAEVFFDPQAHTTRGIPYSTVRDGFLSGCARANSELGMSTQLILCFLRHMPVASAEETFATARADLTSGKLAGIGLDSSEVGFPAGLFAEIYGHAQDLGIRRTSHAGEEGGPEMIREAIERLNIQRIDHGITMARDEDLMEQVCQRNILVTLCPLSNVRLKCVTSVSELPVRIFLERGVRLSVNSDDPAYFGGYILDNYCAVQEAFGLEVKDWERIVGWSVEGAWCEEGRKAEIRSLVGDVVGRFKRGELKG